MRSRAVVSSSPGATSTRRQRRSGAEGARALQCAPGRAARASPNWGGRAPDRRAAAAQAVGEGAVELHAGAEQQDVALEAGELEGAADVLERRRAGGILLR